MRHLKISLATLVTLALVCLSQGFISTTQAQSTALERGYRTGYSDGYNAGFKDSSDRASRDYQSKDEYQRADRSYNDVWGPIEDYRDGYQQGFEAGYAAGYDRQQFNSSVPTGLRRRATTQPVRQVPDNSSEQQTPNTSSAPATVNNPVVNPVVIPRDTVFVVELLSGISTDVSQRGDRFQARVVEPREFEGAIIDGRVTQVKRAGKVKGTSQLQLSFDTIRLADNRTAGFSAVLIDVVNMGGDDVGSVDPEGGVRGRSSTKDDVTKVGAATGIGAIIGAIAGGGKGAAIGAAIGGGIGTGGVLSQRGKDIQLARGQQIKIRTSNDTNINN